MAKSAKKSSHGGAQATPQQLKSKAQNQGAGGVFDLVDKIPMSYIVASIVICGLALLMSKIQTGEMRMPGTSTTLAFESFMSSRPAAWYSDKHKVGLSLPPVTNYDQPFEYATLLTTESFQKEVIQADSEVLVLVVFYDPRSYSFQHLHKEIDAAAKLISHDTFLQTRARICVVNAAVESWLSELYAPLGRTEQRTTRQTRTSFQFGHATTFGMLSRVFLGGQIHGAYKGLYAANELINFVKLWLEPLEPRQVSNADEVISFVRKEGHLPALVACRGLVDEASYKDLVRRFHGMSYSLFVDHEGNSINEVCIQTLDDGAQQDCTVVTYDAFGERFCFTGSSLDVNADVFIRTHARPQLEELRTENAPLYMRSTFICVLIYDLDNLSSYHHLLKVVRAVRRHPQFAAFNPHVEFVLADIKVMGDDFGLADDDTNAILFQSVLLEQAQQESIYQSSHERTDAVNLLDERINVVSENVVRWFIDELAVDFDELVRDHSLFIHKGGLSRAAAGAKQASDRATLTDVQKAQPQLDAKVKPQIDFDPAAEEFKHTRMAAAYAQMPLKEAYNLFANLYSEYAAMEEVWESYSEVEKTAESGMRDGLEMVRNYLQSKPHLHNFVQTIPLTPRRLRDTIEGQYEREELLRALERLDRERVALSNSAVLDSNGQEAIASQRQWAEAAHFMEYAVYEIYKDRSSQYAQQRQNEGKKEPPQAMELQIDRRSADELSVEEFAREYAGKGRPVIIENVNLTRQTWDIDFFKDKCGDKYPNYATLDRSKKTWGGLVSVPAQVTMREFIETYRTVEERKSWYVHDWSLPRQCPEVFGEAPYEEFMVPKYFAGDYMQRLPFEGYHHTWPSLFIGANGTQSLMHVDSGGTNFWMYLVKGVKEWRFFERKDIPNLYARPTSSSFAVDPFEQDGERFPLLGKARMYRGMQKAGDLVFVPGGSPHGVRNHDDVLGLSMNYIDDTNMWLYLWTQLHSGNLRAFETLTQSNFPRGLQVNQSDLSFGKYKSTDWYKLWKEGKLDLIVDNYKSSP